MIRAIKSVGTGVSNIFYKRPHLLLWAGSRTIRVKITVNGRNNRQVLALSLQYIHNLRMLPQVAQHNMAGRWLDTPGLEYHA